MLAYVLFPVQINIQDSIPTISGYVLLVFNIIVLICFSAAIRTIMWFHLVAVPYTELEMSLTFSNGTLFKQNPCMHQV